MRKIPPLKSLQAFESAARLGSFQAAADELFLTPSAISHQIKFLENYFNVKLFHRSHRRIELTDAGRQYAKTVSDAFRQIQAATRDIERLGKSDILTIHSTPSFATQWLMPRLARFSSLYPDIDVRLNATMLVADILAGQADIVIRYGDVFPDEGVELEYLTAETMAVMCSPILLDKNGGLDLANRPLIHSELNVYQWKDWLNENPPQSPTKPLALERGLRFDRTFMSISAAVDGLGIALDSVLMAERELKDGRLVLPFGLSNTSLYPHKLLYAKAKATLPKIVAFREWLYQEIEQSLDGLKFLNNNKTTQ